jgi:hypothetical protein
VGRLFPAAPDFIHGPELGDRVNAKALAESLVHGIKYAFPPEKEGMTRGMPTRIQFQSGRSSKAPMQGYAFLPLYKKAPQAALKDPEL